MYSYARNFTEIQIKSDNIYKYVVSDISIKNGPEFIKINSSSYDGGNLKLILENKINIKYECYIIFQNIISKVYYSELFKSEEFIKKYHYSGSLGLLYNEAATTFRLWAPAASDIKLVLYRNGVPAQNEKIEEFPMHETSGLFSVTIKRDLKGFFYTYKVHVYENTNEVCDPYAKACGINGIRGAIIKLRDTDPKGWKNDKKTKLKDYADAVIYETSVRDFSSFHKSGIKSKGKYSSLTEENTLIDGFSTGIDHICELGITHIQFMPIFDFASIDENNPVQYNWGYDPQNYNIPEGSYSYNAFDPQYRIRELKRMILSLHHNNIAVNIDVVFNHVYKANESMFEKIFPGYFFRFDENGNYSNGSGCGNEIATENSMARKFIIDSVLYWADEYHIDGFRFDLMGLIDINTMNQLSCELKSKNTSTMLYGEGWNMNTVLQEGIKTTDINHDKTPDIAFFNDKIRDIVKGNIFDFTDNGFANGKKGCEDAMKKCICCDYLPPNQSINYVECHDNLTLWDKLEHTNNISSKEERKTIHKLCIGILITSQGVPFIHSGMEFCRTKYGVQNSYASPDTVNCIDWERKIQFYDVFEYTKGLIKLRRAHPAFRMSESSEIKQSLKFLNVRTPNIIAYILKNYPNGDNWKDILVVYNSNFNDVRLEIPYANWNITVNENKAGTDIIEAFTGNSLVISRLTTMVLFSI